MFLVDTNVWLEVLLEQESAEVARRFFEAVDASDLAITEFALYSIGVILVRMKEIELLEDFFSDAIEDSVVSRIRLEIADMSRVLAVHRQFTTLDFDDAYQYVAAEKHGLTIVSFDAHFDRTERGRKTPGQALEVYRQREEGEEPSA